MQTEYSIGQEVQNFEGMYLGMDVGCAPSVTAGEDGLKGGKTIDISHHQTSQEGQLICLACSYPAGCCSPCTT